MTMRERLVATIVKAFKADSIEHPTRYDLTLLILRNDSVQELWRRVYGILDPQYMRKDTGNRLMYEIAHQVDLSWEIALRDLHQSRKPKRKKGRRNNAKIQAAINRLDSWEDVIF